MKTFLAIVTILMLCACKPDSKETVTPKPVEKNAVSVDGTRTDAVDTLISKEKVLDSLNRIKK